MDPIDRWRCHLWKHPVEEIMSEKEWRTVKLAHNPDIDVEPTVTLDGRPLVHMREDISTTDGIDLRPIEAERLGRILIAAAAKARAKMAGAKRTKNCGPCKGTGRRRG